MKQLLSLSLLLVSGIAIAQVSGDELSELEPHQPVVMKNIEIKTEDTVLKEHQIYSYYLPSSGNFDQEGEGQEYSTEKASGMGAMVGMTKSLSSFENQLDTRLMYQQTQFKEPDNIGGESIKTSRLNFNSTYFWQFSNGNNHFFVGPGATIQNESSEKFSNNNKLLSKNLSLGPSASAKWNYRMNGVFSFAAQTQFTVPLYIQEYGKESGYYKNGYQLISSVLMNLSVTRSLSLSVGVLSENQKRTFSGDGERGVKNAKTSLASVSIPVGVVYEY
jgi:hypothetical protein